jgi:hypothetical protein
MKFIVKLFGDEQTGWKTWLLDVSSPSPLLTVAHPVFSGGSSMMS